MLMNNLDPEVAERPDDLVVYGGSGRRRAAGRPSTPSSRRCAARERRDAARAVGQAGRRVPHARAGAARAHRQRAARAGVGDLGRIPRPEARGLTMYGQMTAGSWIYIGTQGILQGTYETFAAAGAHATSAAALAGRLVVTAGLGGMGGAQPLAVDDERRRRPRRRGRSGAHRAAARDRLPRRARRQSSTRRCDASTAWRATKRRARSACVGNAADVLPELVAARRHARRADRPDLRPRPAERLRARPA